jgi:hypothetical protein
VEILRRLRVESRTRGSVSESGTIWNSSTLPICRKEKKPPIFPKAVSFNWKRILQELFYSTFVTLSHSPYAAFSGPERFDFTSLSLSQGQKLSLPLLEKTISSRPAGGSVAPSLTAQGGFSPPKASGRCWLYKGRQQAMSSPRRQVLLDQAWLSMPKTTVATVSI